MHIKKLFPVLAICLIAFTWYTGCKKTDKIVIEKETIEVTAPSSKFSTQVFDRRFNGRQNNTVAVIDSNFYFKNQSDSANNITYTWDFGDGEKSQLRHPVHSYKSGGIYTVRLITNKADQAFDTTQTRLSVIAGQREFEWAGKSVNPIDIVEKGDGDFLFLGFSADKNTFPTVPSYFLITLDKDFRQKNIKTLAANVKLSSIEKCSDNAYICIGNTTGGADQNNLIKISAEGVILWSKPIEIENLVSAKQTADQGFILAGSKNVIVDIYGNVQPRTAIIKTDGNGNVVWNRLFSAALLLKNTYNVLTETDGYTIAGIKPATPSPNYYCDACDSVCLVKLSSTGLVTSSTSIEAALNTGNFGMVNVDLGKTGNYIVTPGNTRGIFVFSSARMFLDRKLTTNLASSSVINNGDIIALQNEYSNGFSVSMAGYSETGARKWYFPLDGIQYSNGGYSCCSNSWPVIVKKLKDGSSLFMASKVDVYDYHYIGTIVRVSADGKIM
ncbi:PKD domain-containing protein [Mucilaginibacter sp. ZT4R22]|uniref:PKD domain-containing protein n=1 Tax=Mucilaginibacter pankratovii TaxID=2772110 RepID=A0ABR7WM21_9SPHI|nr:PKD domain-containing protein [Mucilaginibacter pankratovii]MBD1363357.1 PKD domain-containing protein [Mucilaginibacter pankratovii]